MIKVAKTCDACGQGEEIEVEDNLASLARTSIYRHAECREELREPRRYTAAIEINDNDGLVARASATVQGTSFADVVDELGAKLGSTWERVVKSASIAG